MTAIAERSLIAKSRLPAGDVRSRARRLLFIVFSFGALLSWAFLANARPTVEELKARAVLDDYESNVVFGYDIVMETNRYAGRYAESRLNCTSCHLKGGTQPNGFPLNVAGVYPKWRAKNGVRIPPSKNVAFQPR